MAAASIPTNALKARASTPPAPGSAMLDGAKRVQAQTVRTALDEDCNGEQGQDPGFRDE
jgi:hypothetical protein